MTSYTFDNQNISWNKLGNLEHLEYSMLVGLIPLVKNGARQSRLRRPVLLRAAGFQHPQHRAHRGRRHAVHANLCV